MKTLHPKMADDTIDLIAYNGDKLISTVTVFLVLSWIAVGLRTYTRAWLMKNFQLDDWFMLIGQATFSTYAGFLYVRISKGIGTHNAAIEDDQQKVTALKVRHLYYGFYYLQRTDMGHDSGKHWPLHSISWR